ncbi:MAG: hypothetical protein QOD28_1468 [Acidobacteriota bacterium]|nr:hypothetical protein [Acidobacteriota bacterium]
MDEGKQTNPNADAADTGAQTAARQEEATSSDTLRDLQESQTDTPASQGGTSESSDSSNAPSPDGTPDTSSGRTADDKDSGGPI